MASKRVQDDAGLGERISQALRLRRLSQGQVEKLAGLADAYLTKLISGDRLNPGMQTVVAVARALQVPLVWLATGEGSIDDEPQQLDPSWKVLERYPDRELAIESARRLELDPEAIENIAQQRLDGQLSYAEWLSSIQHEAARLRRERLALADDVKRAEKQQAADQAKLNERAREATPKIPKRRR